MPTTDAARYAPAKKGIVLAALAVLLAGIVLFAAVLRHTTRSATALSPSGYTLAMPEGFEYHCSQTTAGGALTLRGWAVVRGQGIKTVDCWAVLYSAASGSYLRLPTMMEIDETPTALLNDGTFYGRGGFVSITPLSQLADNLTMYELCFAYRSNGYNSLVHTGQMLAEESL